MERDCKRKKTKKRESCEERSPLQHLNGLPIHKRNSNLSSSSSSSAPAASRFLISDNPCSSFSFYSSSRTHLDKKPKTFSKLANNDPSKSRVHTSKMGPRSKENEMPRKPFMQTSRKDKPQFITQRQNWPSNAKPTPKIRQRSKLSSAQGKSEDKMKKGSQEFQEKMKTSIETDSGKCTFEPNRASNGSNSNCAENCTPVSGRVASGHGSNTPNLCDHEYNIEDSAYERANSNANTAIDVKTPPVEPSQSPEIQCQFQSKKLVLKSVGTPVCYGTGHVLSGVSDKRKSRRRGSLRGGPEKTILFSDARRDENVSVDLKESSIPLLAEASVRWHLSPCDVGRGDHIIGSGNKLCDDDTGTLDLLSSPSMLCGNTLDFLCAKSSYGGSVGNVAVNRRSTDVISSPGKATEFPRILEPLSCNMDVSLLATTPNATYCSNGISSTEGKCFSKSLSRGSSILSSGSLNSGNIIQTPDSDSSSDACFGRSRLEVNLSSNSVWPELDPITTTLERMKLSPRSEMSTWDDPGLGTSSADMGSPPTPLDPTQYQRNGDSVSSWVSDTTTDNPTLSQMRISWCDVLASKTAGTDELDCCCCLSDEEIEGDESAKLYSLTKVAEEKESYQSNDSGQRNYIGDASVENKEDGFRILENEFSPLLLDYEPCIPAGGKGKSSSSWSSSPDACAESICTDGGGLVASDDSDWTYFQETACFMSQKEV